MKSVFSNLYKAFIKDFIVFLIVCCHIQMANAQQKSITINCQTPGYLSDDIPVEVQKVLENLTVSGELNNKDLNFISEVILRGKLKHLDLSKAYNKSGSYVGKKNYKLLNFFSMPTNDSWLEYYTDEKIDTVIINEPGMLSGSIIDSKVKNLFISEGVDSICCVNSHSTLYNVKSVHLPTTVKCLPNYFIKSDTVDININGIDYFDHSSIRAYLKTDTIRLSPKLKRWNTCAFKIKNEDVIYIPKSVVYIIDNSCSRQEDYYQSHQLGGKTLEIHCESPIPPRIDTRNDANEYVGYKLLSRCVVYVPVGSAMLYKKIDYFGSVNNPWAYATIIEDRTPVTGIELNKGNISFTEIGQSEKLTATVLPTNATEKSVTWTSSNPAVAVVANGNVVCMGYGTAIIFATTVDGKFMANCTVTAKENIAVTSIELDKSSIDFTEIGQVDHIAATVLPDNATNKNVIWKSSNSSVATVNNGKVVCIGWGKTVISAITEDGDFIATCSVNAKENIAVTGIELDKSSIDFTEIGQSTQLTATVIPQNATNTNVFWSSSNSSVAIVNNGKVVCVGYGKAVIIATTEDSDFMATCTVNSGISGINEINTDATFYIFNGSIYIKKVFGNTKVDLYNIVGDCLFSHRVEDSENVIIPKVPTGLYLLKIGTKTHKITIK